MHSEMDILNKMTREFILNEGQVNGPDIHSYIQSLAEILQGMKPRSMKEARRLGVARQQIKEVRKMARRLDERINTLEEQVSLLEEYKEDK